MFTSCLEGVISLIIGDRYELEGIDKVEEGNFYKAKDLYMNFFVYIKVIDNSRNINMNFMPNLIDESTMILSVESNYIANILDLGVYESYYYIVSEYFEGASLSQVTRTKDLKLKDIMFITKQIVTAMKSCSDCKLYHGALSLNNIFVSDNYDIKIYDLGITKANNGVNIRIGQDMSFMCPHQLNINYTDIESDFFNIGIIIYYLLFKKMPFKIGKNEAEMLRNIDRGVDWEKVKINPKNSGLISIIKKLLNRKEKYQNYNQILMDLSDIMYTKAEISSVENSTIESEKHIKENNAHKKTNKFILKFISIIVLLIILFTLFNSFKLT